MVVKMTRQCNICGKDFEVEIDEKSRKILTDCFYGGKIRFGTGMWSQSKAKTDSNGKIMKDSNGLIIWEKCHSWYVELWYHLIDLKRTILHQYRDVEYWECPKCLNKIKKRHGKLSSSQRATAHGRTCLNVGTAK